MMNPKYKIIRKLNENDSASSISIDRWVTENLRFLYWAVTTLITDNHARFAAPNTKSSLHTTYNNENGCSISAVNLSLGTFSSAQYDWKLNYLKSYIA